MGHKVSPLAFRIGYNKTWKSNGYYDRKNSGQYIARDVAMRREIKTFLKGMPIANVYLNHSDKALTVVTIYTSKSAIVLGKNDENIDLLKAKLEKKFTGTLRIEVKEVKKPELSAALVADSIARQIEKKMPYRRVIKQAISRTLEKGGQGIRVKLGGRLNGAEIARVEMHREGNIPSHTLRADIDYSTDRAQTMYGIIGVKVWIYKGDILTPTT